MLIIPEKGKKKYIGPYKQSFCGKIVIISSLISFNMGFECSKEPSQWDLSFEHPNICKKWWVRKYLQFFLSKPVYTICKPRQPGTLSCLYSQPTFCPHQEKAPIARLLRAKIVLFRIQAWNFPHLLRLVSWWFSDIEPLRQISSAHQQGKIHFRYRKFGLTWLHRPLFAFNMVKNWPTISLDVLKDINKYFLK